MPSRSLRVKSRFEATENVSATARKIEKNTRRLNKTMKRGFRESTRSALKFKGVLKGILAASVIQKGFGLLSQGISEVTTQFIGFDDAITAAAVRFKDIGPDAKNFDQQLKTIKVSAREAGQTTIFTAEQAAVALDFLARAGFTSVEAMGSLNSMINLSIASGEEFAQVADFSSDLLGSFGLAAKDSAQKIANLNRLNDVLVKTVNSANVKVEDLFETMTQVGPVAVGVLGSSLEEAASFAAILGNSGIKSSQAMTALKNIFLRLAAPATEGAQVLEGLGLTLDDGTGKAKGMTAFMQEMGETLKGFSQIEQAKILDAVFGKRAIAGAKIIFDNIEAVKGFKKSLDGAAGTSQKTATIMQTSLGNRIKGLGSALTELGFKVLDPFEKKIKASIVALTEFFRGQDAKPLIDSINLLGKAFELFGTIVKRQLEPWKEFVATIKPLAAELKPIADLLLLGAKKLDEITGAKKVAPVGVTDIALKTATELVKFQTKVIRDIKESGFGVEKGRSAAEIARQRTGITRDPETGEVRILQPNIPTPAQPALNVEVNNNISGVEAEVKTEVKAPGTTAKTGANKF